MNYWSSMERQVTEILRSRRTVDAYPNNELFARWVTNLSPTGRGVICGNTELTGEPFCQAP